MNAVAPDDIVLGVLTLISRKGTAKITSDRRKLHSAFLVVSRKHPDLFREFSFRASGTFHESDELDQALSNLDAAEMIKRYNGIARYYSFTDDLESEYVEYTRPLLEKAHCDLAAMKSVAEELNAELAYL